MTGESGYVASEGFPNLYPPNKKCIWTITVRRPLWSPMPFMSPKPNPDSPGIPSPPPAITSGKLSFSLWSQGHQAPQ